jgi:hypothetical protein
MSFSLRQDVASSKEKPGPLSRIDSGRKTGFGRRFERDTLISFDIQNRPDRS